MKWNRYFSMVVGGIGVLVNYLWGGWDTMLSVLFGFMILDFITGLMCGGKTKTVDSEKAYVGITKKKMMVLIMVAVGVLIDRLINTDGSIRSLVIFYYISMEGISIIENSGKLGFPIPSKLKDILLQLQEDGNNDTHSNR